MKIRLIAALFVLFAVGVYVASVWVPPYGDSPSQLVRLADTAKAAAAIPPTPVPPPKGRSSFYGRLLDSDGRPLRSARVLAIPITDGLGGRAGGRTASIGEDGRFWLELPHGEWEFWLLGSQSRVDSGETRLGRFSVGETEHHRQDLRLPGAAAFLIEIQVTDHPGLTLECELLNALGQVVAIGDAVSGMSALAQATSRILGKLFGTPIEECAGTGLCFEGVSAGKYTLRAFLSREPAFVYEIPLELSAGEVLQLGRIELDLGDFDESLRGQHLQVVE
ncbi:MAG: hypothetical protein ACYS26_00125 [Planctomycetota bacterium]